MAPLLSEMPPATELLELAATLLLLAVVGVLRMEELLSWLLELPLRLPFVPLMCFGDSNVELVLLLSTPLAWPELFERLALTWGKV